MIIINMLGTRRREILIVKIGMKVNEEYYDDSDHNQGNHGHLGNDKDKGNPGIKKQ